MIPQCINQPLFGYHTARPASFCLPGSDLLWTGGKGVGWRWGIRLKVGFQPLNIISPTANWIRRYMLGCVQTSKWFVFSLRQQTVPWANGHMSTISEVPIPVFVQPPMGDTGYFCVDPAHPSQFGSNLACCAWRKQSRSSECFALWEITLLYLFATANGSICQWFRLATFTVNGRANGANI